MSSVVKKSSQFTPKVKRRSIRRGSALATPPTTQAESSAPSTQDDNGQPPHTPDATQLSQSLGAASQLLSYALRETEESERGAEASKAPDNPAIEGDPIDTSNVPEEAIEEEDDDIEGEKATFKKPRAAIHRRSSTAGHRRLSIHQLRRSGSISITPGSQGPDGDDRLSAPPVLIGIPESKPVKKRAPSVSRAKRASRSGAQSFGGIENEATSGASDVEDAEKDKEDTNPHAEKASQPDLRVGDFVYGIDPETNKLMKFKTLESVKSDLPVAPADLVTTISDIKQIPRKLQTEDWKLYSQIEISEDLTMADLCKPTLPFGSISDNYEKSINAKEGIKNSKKIRARARKRARTDRISYEAAFRIESGKPTNNLTQEANAPNILDGDDPEEPQATTSIKMKVVSGKILVDQESMIVTKSQPSAGDRERITENAFENPITSNSYSKLTHTDTWTDGELREFYRALSTWGTDFTFIAQLFPYRTRRQIKRKFILEEKKNPQLVDLALKRQLPGSFEDFEKNALSVNEWKELERRKLAKKKREEGEVGEEGAEGAEGEEGEDGEKGEDGLQKPIGLPSKDKFDLEMQELQREHQRHIEEITTERERAIKEDLEASRMREIEIRTGAKPMTRQQMKAEFKKNEIVVGSLDDQAAKERVLDQD